MKKGWKLGPLAASVPDFLILTPDEEELITLFRAIKSEEMRVFFVELFKLIAKLR